MTALSGDARERLAAALPESLGPIALRRPSPPRDALDRVIRGYGDQILDALLPVVAEIAAQHAAEELRAMADADLRPDESMRSHLRDRAAALSTPATREKEQRDE